MLVLQPYYANNPSKKLPVRAFVIGGHKILKNGEIKFPTLA